MKFVYVLDTSKCSIGDLPPKIIKMAKESVCPYLADCINAVICKCSFSDELKKSDATAIFEKGDPSWKGDYRPISVLAVLPKIYERNMGVQMNHQFIGILLPYYLALSKVISPSMPYVMQPELRKGASIPMALLVQF